MSITVQNNVKMFDDIYKHLKNVMDMSMCFRITEIHYDEYKFTDPDECVGAMVEVCNYLYEHTSLSAKAEIMMDHDEEDYRITISEV